MSARREIFYPDNVRVLLENGNLLIKGPLRAFRIPLDNDNFSNYHYSIPEIQLFNQAGKEFKSISMLSPRGKPARHYFSTVCSLLGRYIQLSSEGSLGLLQMWGIGFKSSRRGHFALLNLGYSHLVRAIDSPNVYIRPFDSSYIFSTSVGNQSLIKSSSDLKKLRRKDPYKGKGIRFVGEKIRLKVGKRD